MDIHYLSETEYLVKDIYVDRIHDRPFCIFDLEGTGIFVDKEYIIQFGAIIYQGGEILRKFSSLVKSPKLIPEGVQQLTGISNDSLTNAPAFADAYRQFLDFCGTAVLVTQAGYEYDLPMLQKHCRMSNLSFFENPVIDTKALFAKIHPELFDVFSTDYFVSHYHIETNDIKRHDALGDCVLISRIFEHILMEYEQKDIHEFNVNEALTVKRFAVPAMYIKEE
ncbi:PolC-type DNA polymerase III [Paenibacillus ginsengarvi]|uniref:3'-5' exonuclease n=1 Tax=Paenibacillus ginsengarvi TaxID=400777 RepID=UPI0013155CCB|nr:3'-5' exonuclease [Paenibacillus ginsengarvi]